jgi:CRP/FNR family transcriptional regulator
MIPENQQERITTTFDFLHAGDDQLNRHFMQIASLGKLPKGQHVCQEGTSCSHLALLLDGTARVYKLGENGKEITLYRIAPGESCILTASCMLNDLPFPAFAICETDVEAALIPANEVQNWLADSSAWRSYVFGLVSQRLSDIIDVVDEVVFRRMDRRIAKHLSQRRSASSDRLTITHQEIASDLGTSREVVSRILKDFENREIIRVTRGAIQILAPDSLLHKAEEP